jgi:hypothetical protein
MPKGAKRTREQVLAEIDVERDRLVGDIRALRGDVAGVLPYAIGTALAVAVLTRSKVARRTLKILWWLR